MKSIESLLILQIVLPLFSALILVILTAKRKWYRIKHITILLMASLIGLNVLGLTIILPSMSQALPLIYHIGDWSPPLGIALQYDGLSAILIFLTAIIFFLSTLYALAYFRKKKQAIDYIWPIWFILWGSLNALFLSRDLFNIYICLELVTLCAVILVAHAKNITSLMASMRYLIVALIGSMLYLLGVVLIYAQNGSLDLILIQQTIGPSITNYLAVALITLGLLFKTALYPFHFWLPPAHGSALTPVSAILSAIVVKSSFYLVLRLWFGAFNNILSNESLYFLGALGAMSIIWGSVQAIRQNDLKQIIAYSTVAQIGYLFLFAPLLAMGMPQEAWNSVIMHALSHGLAKAALFLAVGNIIYVTGKKSLDAFGGARTHMQISVMSVTLASISLMGLPPSGGFIAKWYLIKGALQVESIFWAFVPILGSFLAAIYLFRILEHGMRPAELSDDYQLHRVSPAMKYTPLILASLAVLLGLTSVIPIHIMNLGVEYF